MNRLTRFENHPQYETFKGTDHYTKANVSICTTEYHIHYNGINYENPWGTDGWHGFIAGYDFYNMILINPQTGERYKQGWEEAAKMFEQAGNKFMIPG